VTHVLSAGCDIWDTFTYAPNTFYRGTALLKSTTATSDEACAEKCGALDGCAIWTWCPSDVEKPG